MYPAPWVPQPVSVSLEAVNAALGLELSADDVHGVFVRLGFVVDHNGSTVTVTPPPERLDIQIAEDLIEEVGRIIGYDTVPATELPSASRPPEMNERFARDEAARQYLREQGFSEVFTSVFVEDGERAVSNKIGGDKPYLRSSLVPGLSAALERNVLNKDLLGLRQVKLFEIGTVWRDGKELVEVAIAVEKVKKMKTQEEYQNELDAFTNSLRTTNYELRTPPLSDVRYVPFSKYPFIARDIALWVPAGTSEQDVEAAIRTHAGSLLVRIDLFDRFEKDGRVSYAFRLIFQSMDRTLFDGDATERMESVYAAVKAEGWEVR
jgi:phenylalanyl-tRNA synthetase beta subunit